jgi:hypothetical protein
MVTGGVITVKRGARVLPRGNSDIGEHGQLRGKRFEAVL